MFCPPNHILTRPEKWGLFLVLYRFIRRDEIYKKWRHTDEPEFNYHYHRGAAAHLAAQAPRRTFSVPGASRRGAPRHAGMHRTMGMRPPSHGTLQTSAHRRGFAARL